MEKIEYTAPNGTVIEISQYSTDYKISSFVDDNPEIRLVEREGYRQNGTDYLGTLYKSRFINISFFILASTQYDLYQKRRVMQNTFYSTDTTEQGVLTYTNDYLSYSINCVPFTPPRYSQVSYGVTRCEIVLKATIPYWLDNDDNIFTIGGFIGGLHFPLVLPTIFGILGETSTITNYGDVNTPVTIEFNGTATNPKVTNLTTNEFIEVETTLLAGEKLVITTEYGNKDVLFFEAGATEGVKAFNLINPESTFFDLVVGDNLISFSSDTGSPLVTIYYKQRYVGV